MKENFLLKKSLINIVNELSDEDSGKLFKGILDYANTGVHDLTGYLKIIFIPIKEEIDKNEEHYTKTCEKRKNAINKRWGKEKLQEDTNVHKCIEENTNEYKSIQMGSDTHNHNHNNNHKSNKRVNRVIGEEEREEKKQFGEFVTMTNVEYEKLVSTYGEKFTKSCIEILDNYKGSSGKKYKSDYRAILSWVVDKVQNNKPKNKPMWIEKEVAEDTATDEEIEKLMKQLGGI